jgi:hypothetical protein
MASTYLTYTPSSAVTLGTKATISFWVKRSKIDSGTDFYGILSSNGGWNDGTGFAIGFREDMLVWYNLKDNSGYRTYPASLRKFRDCNSWYHILYQIDTTQSAVQDRITLYVNGEDQGDMATNTGSGISAAVPDQNNAPYQFFDSGDQHQIGRGGSAGSTYFDGSLSHFHYVDGSVVAPTQFGSTDATTGEWKINTSPSYTVGNNGFFVLKDGNSITDQSANSNNFAVAGGTLTKTEDCPSNVFATFNPLDFHSRDLTMSNGNLTATNSGSATWESKYAMSTLAMSAGKYYAEFKVGNVGTDQLYVAGIIAEPESQAINSSIGSFGIGLYSPGKIFNLTTEAQSGLGAIVANDIIGVAFDVTNGTLQFYKNGSTIGSQITSIATSGKFWRFGCNGYDGSWVMNANFGNGYFGTTAISSEGTNASGIGKFEYDVPSGYTALSTKGLNE